MLVGKMITYYKFGAVKQEENYSDGIRTGWLKEFFENGKLKKE
jgi:antitoxin component YwqK of YwqJK toxin-antitoxin module